MLSLRRGYIALLSVLIISAVAASTVLILFITSLSSSLNSTDTARGKITKSLAEACAELALQRLTNNCANDLACCSNGTPQCGVAHALSQGSCTITSITNTSGTSWRIRTTGTSTIGSITKYLEIQAERPNPGVAAATVSSWKECVDFSTTPCPLP